MLDITAYFVNNSAMHLFKFYSGFNVHCSCTLGLGCSIHINGGVGVEREVIPQSTTAFFWLALTNSLEERLSWQGLHSSWKRIKNWAFPSPWLHYSLFVPFAFSVRALIIPQPTFAKIPPFYGFWSTDSVLTIKSLVWNWIILILQSCTSHTAIYMHPV